MTVQVSYPGVYIQELPSGSYSIAGVPTSITAFMGRATRGPLGTDENGPVTVFSFQEYVNNFGGLSHDSPMSYAVQDFFLNGGGQAVIVRLFEQVASTTTPPPTVNYYASFMANAPSAVAATGNTPPYIITPSTSTTGLTLNAANPGTWGNNLSAKIDASPPGIVAKALNNLTQYGVQPGDPLFNLTVFYTSPSGQVQTEYFQNLTVTGDNYNPNRVDNVLQYQSTLVRADSATLPAAADMQSALNDWAAYYGEVTTLNITPNDVLNNLPTPTGTGQVTGNPPTDAGDSVPISATTYGGDGVASLEKVDIFNLLCVPADYDNDAAIDTDLTTTAAVMLPYCVIRRAVMILDPLMGWVDNAVQGNWTAIQPTDYGISGDEERSAAVYFPRVIEADPLMKNQPITRAPCGIIAGVIAATDAARGVWKAPAGIEAGLNNILQLEFKMNDNQNGILNPLGINCLRTFPVIGSVVWGARTLRGADELEDDYKYLNVRRLTLYVEESLYRGTKWAVFEPNTPTLWGALTASINAFLAGLQRQGAFYSYFVQCDATTTATTDIDLGVVNVLVGIAPVRPAEFVVISIQQQTLQPAS